MFVFSYSNSSSNNLSNGSSSSFNNPSPNRTSPSPPILLEILTTFFIIYFLLYNIFLIVELFMCWYMYTFVVWRNIWSIYSFLLFMCRYMYWTFWCCSKHMEWYTTFFYIAVNLLIDILLLPTFQLKIYLKYDWYIYATDCMFVHGENDNHLDCTDDQISYE